MKNFLLSLLPTHVPRNVDPSNHLLVIQERILHLLILTITVLSGVYFTLIVSQGLKRSPLFTNLIGVIFLILTGLALLRIIPFKVRSWFIIMTLYAMSLSAILIYGVDGYGLLLALSVSVVIFLIRGIVIGLSFALLNTITFIAVGILMVRGIIPPPPPEYQYSSTMIEGWVYAGLVFIVLTTAVSAAVVTMVKGMKQAIDRQTDLSNELMEERKNLESRILQRTQDVERHANQLEIAATIAHQVSQETNLDRLLTNSVDLIRSQFNLYFVAIFLVDNSNEIAALRAGTGDVGRKLLEQHYSIPLGQMGMVPVAIQNNEIRLSGNVQTETNRIDHPYLMDTRSELALPLRLEGKVIGAMDFQSIHENNFSPDDVKVIQATADQIAVAIQRARLIDQLEQSLESMEKGLGQYTQQSWNTFLKSNRQSYAYRYDKTKLEQGISLSPESSQAMRSGERVMQQPTQFSPTTRAAIPIRLRNQVLGVLDVHFDGQKIPSDMIPLLEAASDRLALALENARLLEDIKSRIESDRIVSEISGRVRSATSIDHVLKTAAMELGRSLGLSEVIVQLKTSD